MNKPMSFTALAAVLLIGSLPANAWSAGKKPNGSPAEQTPAPATGTVQGWQAPSFPGGYAQRWQQPPRWGMPQQGYGHVPPQYPPAGQYQPYAAAPATTRENPLSGELKQTQEALSARSSELDEANSMLEQLRGELQDSHANETALIDKLAYNTREQQTLRVRVTELTQALNSATATLDQQHQLIDNHQANNRQLATERDRMARELAGRDEHLSTLQSEIHTTTQALAQARTKAGIATEALDAARVQVSAQREALSRLEAELERLAAQLQTDPPVPTE